MFYSLTFCCDWTIWLYDDYLPKYKLILSYWYRDWYIYQHALFNTMKTRYKKMIIGLRLILCTMKVKWADWHRKAMKQIQRWNTLQICPRRDSKRGGSELWSNTLLLGHAGGIHDTERSNHSISIVSNGWIIIRH